MTISPNEAAENGLSRRKPKAERKGEEHPQTRIVEIRARSRGGRSTLADCLVGFRNHKPGKYVTIFPDQTLLDKNWEQVVIGLVFTGDVLESFRLREGKPGEGRVLRKRFQQRPYYDFPLAELGSVGDFDLNTDARQRVETSFDDEGRCLIHVGWRVRS